MDKKEMKRNEIILKAKDIFISKGLFNTKMEDIANEAGLTRRTMYRYFSSIEDLAYEATILLLEEWNEFHSNIYPMLEGNGLKRFEMFLHISIDYMEKRRDIMKYLGEFDFYFAQSMHKEPAGESAAKFGNVILQSDKLIDEFIRNGVSDGSIKKNLNIPMAVATISNVLWGFGQRVAVRDNLIKEESGISGIELIRYQTKLYIDALKEN